MARDIPLDKPLTRADRKYLEDRGQYALVARIEQNYPQDDPDEQPLPFHVGGDAGLDAVSAENAALRAELEALKASQSPKDDDELPPYIEWKKEDLVKEAEARKLATTGTKQELADRLDAYDAQA